MIYKNIRVLFDIYNIIYQSYMITINLIIFSY